MFVADDNRYSPLDSEPVMQLETISNNAYIACIGVQ